MARARDRLAWPEAQQPPAFWEQKALPKLERMAMPRLAGPRRDHFRAAVN